MLFDPWLHEQSLKESQKKKIKHLYTCINHSTTESELFFSPSISLHLLSAAMDFANDRGE